MKALFIIGMLAAFLVPTTSFSQEAQDCGTTEYVQKIVEETPGLQNSIQQILREVATWMQNHPYDAHLHQIPVVIPIVVHNVHRIPSERVSVGEINRQIEITNRHLARRADSLATVPTAFRNLAANIRIKLMLAVRDPNGAATNGINYVTTTKSSFSLNADDVKKAASGGADPWDTDKYLNVWICNLQTYCGYASFPYLYAGQTPSTVHGIVMANTCWGSADFRSGATFTHELGHFVGLKHIWGDSNCGNDDIADTPTQSNSSSNCPTGIAATGCPGTGPEGRMYQNFMDYSSCQSLFTHGQARRAWGFLNYYTRRSSLLSSDALLPLTGMNRTYVVDFIPEYNNLPAWKAALAMVHGAAVGQCIPVAEINRLCGDGQTARGNRYQSLPTDLANAVFGLGLDAEEVLACYSARGFHDQIMNRGPVALMELSGSSIHGITLTGMTGSGANTMFEINDPMNVGPREFSLLGIEQRGHRKIVTYASLANFMDQAVINNRKIILARPMRSAAR